jgi:hypothetical protein
LVRSGTLPRRSAKTKNGSINKGYTSQVDHYCFDLSSIKEKISGQYVDPRDHELRVLYKRHRKRSITSAYISPKHVHAPMTPQRHRHANKNQSEEFN